MAQRVEIKTISTPAATLRTAPQTTLLTWRPGYPTRVEFPIPPGPSGLMGIRLTHSGVVVIPHDESEWLITDNETPAWDLEGYPYNAKWAVVTFNEDVYAHSFQLRMLFNEIGRTVFPGVVAVPIVAPTDSSDDDPGQSEEP